jgi:gamma-glutamylcyclotransferase
MKEEGLSWYFAYGSNMDAKALARRIGRASIQGERAVLPGYRVLFNQDGGYAGIEPSPGSLSWGVLYRLREEELLRLDRYEGVPECYLRGKLPVRRETGEEVQAYVYLGILPRAGVLPSKAYLASVLRGAKEHGLPREYVEELRRLGQAGGKQGKGNLS